MSKDLYLKCGPERSGDNLQSIVADNTIDVFTKIRLLSIFLGTNFKEIARIEYKKLVQPLINRPSDYSVKVIKPSFRIINQLGDLYPSVSILDSLPNYSFYIQFKFTLAKPFLSRDDEVFYICDTPVRKEKVFKVPMVEASTWKGNMRWVAMKQFTDELPVKINENNSEGNNLGDILGERCKLIRLFGHEKDNVEDYINSLLTYKLLGWQEDEEIKEEDRKKMFKETKDSIQKKFIELLKQKGYVAPNIEGRKGRLIFYPTFFDQIGLEVINPHDRKTKTGTNPIIMESVPEGAKGIFTLFYVPFDLIGKSDNEVKVEINEDIRTVLNSVYDLMFTYGFSAKKSCGFGVINKVVENGVLKIKGYEERSFGNFTELREELRRLLNSLSLKGQSNVDIGGEL